MRFKTYGRSNQISFAINDLFAKIPENMFATKGAATLQKQLLQEASKFKCYYYRKYFERKINHMFQDHEQKSLIDFEKFLGMIKRQVIIDNMYASKEWLMDNYKQ
ncbi:hypothetical protein HZS_7283 [Henneguya salminicola]|uniref:Protein bcn92 (Trinotate prediction) n=1 Tax=Henneguya salminicola TaxID=69463 RepID=A0A6G3MMF7_HENSL|nr:hypothetical protein HZS_7283 [Henneguya salminicola]